MTEGGMTSGGRAPEKGQPVHRRQLHDSAGAHLKRRRLNQTVEEALRPRAL